MKIKVNAGGPALIAVKLGPEPRRSVFISPWGVFLDKMPPAPAKANLTDHEYEVEAGPAGALLSEALAAKHAGLLTRVSVVPEPERGSKKGTAPAALTP